MDERLTGINYGDAELVAEGLVKRSERSQAVDHLIERLKEHDGSIICVVFPRGSSKPAGTLIAPMVPLTRDETDEERDKVALVYTLQILDEAEKALSRQSGRMMKDNAATLRAVAQETLETMFKALDDGRIT